MKDTSEEKMCNKIRSVYLALAVLTRGSARELSWSLGVAVFVGGIWAGVASDWYAWYADGRHMLWAKASYAFLDGRWRVHMPIVMLLGAGMFWWWRQIWEDRDVRWLRLWLPLLGIFLLCWEYDEGAYVRIVWLLDYRHLLLFLLGGTALLSVGQILREVKRRVDSCEEEAAIGFSEDAPSDAKISEHLKAYVALIIRRLRATQILQQSYAIGLVGQWGSGKSTLLYEFREQIVQGGAAEIVAFNPWLCNSPEQITKDFFAALREQLSKKYSSLSKSIREYANSVADLSVQIPFFAGVQAALRNDDESLQEKKEKLSKLFARLPHKVFVFIDDMDRLESEEVFEVLRLIRNTADLSNVVYVVAYDKEYVTRVLEEKKICDPAAYLEKIFQIEVPLPKVEGYQLWETLKEGIAVQLVHTHHISNRDFVEALFCGFNQSQRTLILRVLNTYRRAKRFARTYALMMNYLEDNHMAKETHPLDVFWLELLRIYDRGTYDVLANEPLSLLEVVMNDPPKRYRVQPEVRENHEKIYSKPETWLIVEYLFDEEFHKNSIRYWDNYWRYFCLNLSPRKVSTNEMDELLNADSPEEIVNRWFDAQKDLSSIGNQLEQIDVDNLSVTQLQSFLWGYLSIALRVVNQSCGEYISAQRLLLSEHYKGEIQPKALVIIARWIKSKIEDGDEKVHVDLSRLLKNFYIINCVYDSDGRYVLLNRLVVSNGEIEKWLQQLMKTFLEKHSEYTALDCLNLESPLRKVFRNCCVYIGEEYKQVAFDVVIEHFSQNLKRGTRKAYTEAHQRMFLETYREKGSGYLIIPSEEDEDKYFGSDKSKLEEFRNRCFE